jgi:small subunit ribosomal protein S20
VANHKSAKKRIRQTETRRQNNKWKVSRVRTEVKKLRGFIAEANKEAAEKQLPVVQALLAKLAKSSAIRKDTAGRKTGRLASQVAKL